MASDTKKDINKFYSFLKVYINKLTERVSSIDNELRDLNRIKSFKTNKNVSSLLEMDSKKLDLDVRIVINSLVFLIKEEAVNTPQFDAQLSSLFSFPIFREIDLKVKKLELEKIKFEEEIRISKSAISHTELPIKNLVSLLKSSNLTEDERMSVLFMELLDRSDLTDDEKILVLSDITTEDDKEILIEIPKETISEIDEDNALNLLEDAKKFYEDNYLVIKDDSDEVSSRRKSLYFWIDIMALTDSKEIPDISNNEKLGILLYQLKSLISEFEIVLVDYKENKSKESLKRLKELSEKIHNYVSIGKGIEKEEVLENVSSSELNDVIFLTDDDNRPLFDIDSFDADIKKSIEATVIKLRGMGTEIDTHLAILNDKKDAYTMRRIQVSGNIKCSYIILSNNVILVVTIGKGDELFDNSLKFENRYHNKITYFKELSLKNKESLIEQESEITEEITSKFSSNNPQKQ